MLPIVHTVVHSCKTTFPLFVFG